MNLASHTEKAWFNTFSECFIQSSRAFAIRVQIRWLNFTFSSAYSRPTLRKLGIASTASIFARSGCSLRIFSNSLFR